MAVALEYRVAHLCLWIATPFNASMSLAETMLHRLTFDPAVDGHS
jgi:hypothetical protein